MAWQKCAPPARCLAEIGTRMRLIIGLVLAHSFKWGPSQGEQNEEREVAK